MCHPHTPEQLRAVDLAVVEHGVRVAIGGDREVALTDPRADLRPPLAVVVEQADSSVSKVVRTERRHAGITAGASDRHSEVVGASDREQGRRQIAILRAGRRSTTTRKRSSGSLTQRAPSESWRSLLARAMPSGSRLGRRHGRLPAPRYARPSRRARADAAASRRGSTVGSSFGGHASARRPQTRHVACGRDLGRVERMHPSVHTEPVETVDLQGRSGPAWTTCQICLLLERRSTMSLPLAAGTLALADRRQSAVASV